MFDARLDGVRNRFDQEHARFEAQLRDLARADQLGIDLRQIVICVWVFAIAHLSSIQHALEQ